MISKIGKINNSTGFILIEVMVAFTIIIFGIVACFGSLSRSLKVSQKIEKKEKTVEGLKPLFFEAVAGQRDDIALPTLDFLSSNGKVLAKLELLAQGVVTRHEP